jgi:hypothetical protein
MHEPALQIDLILAERAQLRRPQPVPVCDQDHRRVAVPVSPAHPRAFHQLPTSLTVRYSRGRRFAFKRRRGGTVPFTRFGARFRLPRFAAEIRVFTKGTVP